MLSSNAMHWDFALILIFLGVAVPWLGRRRIRQLMAAPQTTKMDRLVLYASTCAFQWFAAGVILWRAHAHHIAAAELGVAIPNTLLVALTAFILGALVFANQIFSLRKLAIRPAEIRGSIPQLALKIFPQDNEERLVFFALVTTVAVCEEFIYRGFVQHVFEKWSGGYVIAGILGSAVMFGLAHLYQGRRGLISTFAIGLLFSGVRFGTGSLVPPLVAHFAADLTAGFLAPKAILKSLESANKDNSEPSIAVISDDSK
jgi:membrane protease YdiL (CAAX protease family)